MQNTYYEASMFYVNILGLSCKILYARLTDVIIVACIYKVKIKIWESESGLPPNPQRGQTTFNHVYAKLFLKMTSFLSLKGLNKVDLERENWTELSLSEEVAVAV